MAEAFLLVMYGVMTLAGFAAWVTLVVINPLITFALTGIGAAIALVVFAS